MSIKMTDEEIIAEMRGESLLNQVRRLMTGSAGKIEQLNAQRKPMHIMEQRRVEFDDAREVIALIESAEIARLARENERLREALIARGIHSANCASRRYVYLGPSHLDPVCDCGLSAALSREGVKG